MDIILSILATLAFSRSLLNIERLLEIVFERFNNIK